MKNSNEKCKIKKQSRWTVSDKNLLVKYREVLKEEYNPREKE